MYEYPEYIEKLINRFRQLPGIGRRGAERVVLDLLDWAPERVEDFGETLRDMPQAVGFCPECGAYCRRGELCTVCSDPKRTPATICVVETTNQLAAIEAGGRYEGRYLVLGGHLSPIDREMGEGLNLDLLKRKAFSSEVKEVILALGSDVEGRATASFITDMLQGSGVSITRPATGLPAGGNLSYADAATIVAAFDARRKVEN